MKKIVNYIVLLFVCFFPFMVNALELEYELENKYFLYENNGSYYYGDPDVAEGYLYSYNDKGKFLEVSLFYDKSKTSEEEFYSSKRYVTLINQLNYNSFYQLYDSSTRYFYYVDYVAKELYYYEYDPYKKVSYTFEDDLDFVKKVLGNRYNVYLHFENNENMYIYKIDVFDNTIVIYWNDNEYNGYISIYDKDYELIKQIDGDNLSIYNTVKEIDGIIYKIDDNKTISTYKLDGTKLDTFQLDSELLDLDRCGSYEIKDLYALNNKLFVVYNYIECPPVRMAFNDEKEVLIYAKDIEYSEGFTQVYSLNYNVDKVQSNDGDFTYLEKVDDKGKVYVELDIKPKEGYSVKEIIVTDMNGNKLEVTDNKFYKPMNNVTIEVKYVEGVYLPIPDTFLSKSITFVVVGLILVIFGVFSIKLIKAEKK